MLVVEKPDGNSEIGLEAWARSARSDQAPSVAGGVWLEVATRERARLWELPRGYLCSIVGTCLTLAEARKLVEKRDGQGTGRLSDLELQEQLVLMAADPAGGSRDLQKYLDRRFAVTIRRLDKAKEAQALLAGWRQSLAHTELPLPTDRPPRSSGRWY